MSLLLVEMNPSDVEVDESVFPDEWKDWFVYEHLRYCCSKSQILSVVKIHVTADAVTAMSGQTYLSIARDLGRTSIRAVVDWSSPEEAVKQFLKRPSVTKLDYKAIREEEDKTLYWYGWFIFFFEEGLGEREREIFERDVVGFLKQIKLPPQFEAVERIQELTYPFSGRCAEVKAFRSADERWYAPFRVVLSDFHKNVARIASFQGTKFSRVGL